VLLIVKGTTIVKATPVIRTFEGQTVGALTVWAQKRFGGPIVVKKLSYPQQG
jgi:hypothetical protein